MPYYCRPSHKFDTDSDNDIEQSESECEADNEDSMCMSETQSVLDCWDS